MTNATVSTVIIEWITSSDERKAQLVKNDIRKEIRKLEFALNINVLKEESVAGKYRITLNEQDFSMFAMNWLCEDPRLEWRMFNLGPAAA
jgi:hypothetical protein